jgi:acetyl-CoA carboxylase carboxyl transferase subunit beta
MAWFKRSKPGIKTGSKPQSKKEMPDLWMKCDECGEIIYKKQLVQNSYVCTKCDYHFRIRGRDYIELLLDENSFEETDAGMESVDFLHFKDSKRYADKLKDNMKRSGLKDAIITGHALLASRPVEFGVMDFEFIGGSMGSVVGEKVARSVDRALERKCPLIILCATGGARMMESIISLMQMAKTAAKLARFSDAGGLYVPVLTNPTTAGVVASYAMLGDVCVAEPGALIGFAGPRVIKQTIGQDLPPGFQRSQFQLEHGFVDMIVNRKELRATLVKILSFFAGD